MQHKLNTMFYYKKCLDDLEFAGSCTIQGCLGDEYNDPFLGKLYLVSKVYCGEKQLHSGYNCYGVFEKLLFVPNQVGQIVWVEDFDETDNDSPSKVAKAIIVSREDHIITALIEKDKKLVYKKYSAGDMYSCKEDAERWVENRNYRRAAYAKNRLHNPD